jgi:drug/metabolite transporter (DMT)-like permease
LCAVSFTLHIFATDRGVRDHSVGGLLVIQLAVVGIFSLAVATAAGDLQVPRGATVWSALIITSLIASALGFFVQTYAQQHASPARVALILASEPDFAGFFAYVLAGQTFTGAGWLGAALILGAIVTVEALPYLTREKPVPELEPPLPQFD